MALTISTAIGASIIVALGATPAPGSALAGVSPSGLLPIPYQEVLKTLGINILVPGTVPDGFSVAKLEVEPCPADSPVETRGVCRFGPGYRITYRKADSTCFAIEAVGGGVGGPAFEYSFDVEHPLFGTVPIYFGELAPDTQVPTMAQRQSAQNNTHSEWIGVGPFYRVIADIPDNGTVPCFRGITPDEAGEVVMALQWLSANP